MQNRKTLSLIVLALVFVIAACQSTPTPEVMIDKPPTATEAMAVKDEMPAATATAEMMEEKDMSDDGMMADKDDDMGQDDMADDAMSDDKSIMEVPAWFGIELVNASSGEAFSLGDFAGKVVLVENLAQWCSNCKKQQDQVLALTGQIGENPDLVIVGLDIDPNSDAASLKSYTASNGFIWTYAVAPAELSRQIGIQLGDQFLNPPSTPMFIIDRHGEIHPLGFGIKSSADLYDAVQQFLAGDM